ncbi:MULTISPECIES: TetR family transcriptional regulator [Alphaproteobacteria]|uniref:TetR family transcriptional regulator n=2 Tax=Alphaproteobacteria TaxID=28211 RepID=A0A512HL36_9HYPH|nr:MULTISPECIES: TetR family transcriptional regulator [Alphaproteobacteria]GEO86166.1 TetR family transcriptional regulator [Ciceribacter naphthalenivorans]GLR22733.1 TetR family transcriptional regulator [Ciceribacter naphthalenivorans]GLT05589.1 TetR family transcriptional regulator [Sphingomonas psychrolutea]
MNASHSPAEQHPDSAVRQENIRRILEAAERLFRHYGYGKTTVADIARDLGMSPANIYRFFDSKNEILQELCRSMLGAGHERALQIAAMPVSAEERLRRFVEMEHRMTVETMMDAEKVHEMVIVAIEQNWDAIERHIDRMNDVVETIISDGIADGEFVAQDARVAARCFGASTLLLSHPQLVAQCLYKENRASPQELTDFAIRALKR